jgi:hypothetical protein
LPAASNRCLNDTQAIGTDPNSFNDQNEVFDEEFLRAFVSGNTPLTSNDAIRMWLRRSEFTL